MTYYDYLGLSENGVLTTPKWPLSEGKSWLSSGFRDTLFLDKATWSFIYFRDNLERLPDGYFLCMILVVPQDVHSSPNGQCLYSKPVFFMFFFGPQWQSLCNEGQHWVYMPSQKSHGLALGIPLNPVFFLTFFPYFSSVEMAMNPHFSDPKCEVDEWYPTILSQLSYLYLIYIYIYTTLYVITISLFDIHFRFSHSLRQAMATICGPQRTSISGLDGAAGPQLQPAQGWHSILYGGPGMPGSYWYDDDQWPPMPRRWHGQVIGKGGETVQRLQRCLARTWNAGLHGYSHHQKR